MYKEQHNTMAMLDRNDSGEAVKWQKVNVKLKRLRKNLARERGLRERDVHIYGFSLPSGVACPHAVECLTFSDRYTGKITDGAHQQYGALWQHWKH